MGEGNVFSLSTPGGGVPWTGPDRAGVPQSGQGRGIPQPWGGYPGYHPARSGWGGVTPAVGGYLGYPIARSGQGVPQPGGVPRVPPSQVRMGGLPQVPGGTLDRSWNGGYPPPGHEQHMRSRRRTFLFDKFVWS